MSHRLKFGIAAGTLGLGVATLAMVGTGAFASFTGQVKDDTSITAGTFHLSIPAADPSAVFDPAPATVTPATWDPVLTADGFAISPGTTNTVTITQTNADPSSKYVYDFTVFDSGTLSGVVNKLVYQPSSSLNSLMAYANVEVEECVHNNGACQSVRTTLNVTTGWQPVSYAPTNSPSPPPAPPYPADAAHTLIFRYPGGDGLNGFLNPNSVQGASNGNPGNLKSEDSGWITYRVIVTFTQTNIPNSAQGQGFSFTLTATGINI
jgi:hypothetical protein